MSAPPTRLRSKTPDPAVRSSKRPPSAKRLLKAQAALKNGRTPCATPVRSLTFKDTPQVVPIQAENPSPSQQRVEGAQPAMSMEEADKLLAGFVSRLKGFNSCHTAEADKGDVGSSSENEARWWRERT